MSRLNCRWISAADEDSFSKTASRRPRERCRCWFAGSRAFGSGRLRRRAAGCERGDCPCRTTASSCARSLGRSTRLGIRSLRRWKLVLDLRPLRLTRSWETNVFVRSSRVRGSAATASTTICIPTFFASILHISILPHWSRRQPPPLLRPRNRRIPAKAATPPPPRTPPPEPAAERAHARCATACPLSQTETAPRRPRAAQPAHDQYDDEKTAIGAIQGMALTRGERKTDEEPRTK